MRNPLRSNGISTKAQEQQALRGRMHLLTDSITEISEKLEHQIFSRQSIENQRNVYVKNARFEKQIEELKVMNVIVSKESVVLI
jgi:hypothetical protein